MSNRYAAYDEYGLRYIPHHLARAGRVRLLRGMLFDFDWLQTKLNKTDIIALITDYDLRPDDPDLHLVQSALRLSEHILGRERRQLASQLVGRLLGYEQPEIVSLLHSVRLFAEKPWLEPLNHCLFGPRDNLVRTLHIGKGGYGQVNSREAGIASLVVTPDNRQAIMVDTQGEITAVDLRDGMVSWRGRLESLSKHAKSFTLAPDGKKLAYCADTRIEVWDIRPSTTSDTQDYEILDISRRLFSVATRERDPDFWFADDCRCLVYLEHNLAGMPRLLAYGLFVAAMIDLRLGLIFPKPEFDFPHPPNPFDPVEHEMSNRITFDKVSLFFPTFVNLFDLLFPGRFIFLDALSGQELRRIQARGLQGKGDITPDAGLAVMFDEDGASIKVFDLITGHRRKIIKGFTTIERYRLDYSNYGPLIPSPRELPTSRRKQTIERVAISSSGERAVVVLSVTIETNPSLVLRNYRVEIWDLVEGKRATRRELGIESWDQIQQPNERRYDSFHHRSPVLAISPDGRTAITAWEDRAILVWNLNTGGLNVGFPGHSEGTATAAFAPNGAQLLTAGWDGTMRIWDFDSYLASLAAAEQRKTQEKRTTLHSGKITCVAFTPDSRKAIIGSIRGEIIVWDVLSNKLVHRLSDGGGTEITGLSVTSDGKHLISTSVDNREIDHNYAIAYPDGTWKPFVRGAEPIRGWDLETGLWLERDDIRSIYSSQKSQKRQHPSNIRLEKVGNNRLEAWDVQEHSILAAFELDADCSAHELSSDGRLIVVGDTLGGFYLLRLQDTDNSI